MVSKKISRRSLAKYVQPELDLKDSELNRTANQRGIHFPVSLEEAKKLIRIKLKYHGLIFERRVLYFANLAKRSCSLRTQFLLQLLTVERLKAKKILLVDAGTHTFMDSFLLEEFSFVEYQHDEVIKLDRDLDFISVFGATKYSAGLFTQLVQSYDLVLVDMDDCSKLPIFGNDYFLIERSVSRVRRGLKHAKCRPSKIIIPERDRLGSKKSYSGSINIEYINVGEGLNLENSLHEQGRSGKKLLKQIQNIFLE